jgi:tetratricopeptide (TPR) repeat protein
LSVSNVSDLLYSAKKLYDEGNYKRALHLLEEVSNLSPSHSEAFFMMGNIYHIEGNLGKAIKAFNKVIELDPGNTDASISLSVILNDIGRYEDAKNIFDKADKKIKSESSGVKDPHVDKKFSTKHYELAEMYFAYNRLDEALFEYNKTIELNSENLDARIKVAKVYAKKGFTHKAIEVLRAVKSDHPHFSPARVALGLVHYGLGNVVEAQTEWQQALMREPNNQELHMYLSLSKDASETVLHI